MIYNTPANVAKMIELNVTNREARGMKRKVVDIPTPSKAVRVTPKDRIVEQARESVSLLIAEVQWLVTKDDGAEISWDKVERGINEIIDTLAAKLIA